MLLVPLTKAGEQDDLLVRLAVAVGVLGVKDIGRAGDDHTSAPGGDAGRIAEVVEKDGCLVVRAVVFLRSLTLPARLGFLRVIFLRSHLLPARLGFLQELDLAA